ncbi:DUF1906 domain-containing protein [Frigoribacterium faeni]|uniref:glycoside hydrolase domain-containing protein n=1 Tax=Frigoribacterium faeni TaxID=145483 RepID=UPI001FAC3F20|nr:glycoside hydrolase domain-containing protein [Frigoribacterium faeni]MCJ0702145.1 DUF1906 domain-containing protein [Frigoribacterium faeni]
MFRDLEVERAQKHLNDTYGHHSWFTRLTLDGQTGWSTMFALTRALQHELGISAKSDSFGPTTMSTLTSKVGSLTTTNAASHRAITALAQCGLWCKGYKGGATFGSFSSDVATGIIEMKADMGLPPTASLPPKAFKSLLTMDAYKRVGRGTAAIRDIQKWMNSRYHSRQDFFIVPCDGIFSRDVQRGLMLALQYEVDMADGVANGNFGPGTQAVIKSKGLVSSGSRDTTRSFVRLFQSALTFNGYEAPFDGAFGDSTAAVVRSFQSFAELSTTGAGDFRTWASLLVSTGDTSRPGTAADASTVLTPATAALLKAHGYNTVGRYLSVAAKRIAPGELDVIFDAGLKVFPIFQEWNNAPGYFTEAAGYGQAVAAVKRARNLGFTAGTTIFFAVDYDATATEIPALIIPYFRGIARGVASSRLVQYKVGIYGTRNVCSQVSEAGLAASSFVSGMSTGYSGNLGFPLPKNWAYDQVLEYKLTSGATSLELDKDIASSRADPVGRGQVLPVPYTANGSSTLYDEQFAWNFTEHSHLAESHGHEDWSDKTYSDFILHRFQRPQYWQDSAIWKIYTPLPENLLGGVSNPYRDALRLARGDYERDANSVGTPTKPGVDLAHFAASVRSYMTWGVPESGVTTEIGDLGGWALDLATCWGEYVEQRRKGPVTGGLTAFLRRKIGGPNGYFTRSDLLADTDAFLVAKRIGRDPNRPLSDVMRELRRDELRHLDHNLQLFYEQRFGASKDFLKRAIRRVLDRSTWGPDAQVPAFVFLRDKRFPGQQALIPDPRDPGDAELLGEIDEFVDAASTRLVDLFLGSS